MQPDFLIGTKETNIGSIPVISTKWSAVDFWSTIKVRWSIGRMGYIVTPGVYAIGAPGKDSRIFVTANFKLSFDHLRRALSGMNAWILVLNTKGINVWCAAGKKTFGTDELVNRIKKHELEKLVNHRKIILPQLGATGVAAHKVRELTGFSVLYGPVRADDIKSYIDSGLKATTEMRTITFPLRERIKLIPVDIFYAGYWLLLVPAIFLILSGLSKEGYSIDRATELGHKAVINLFTGYLSGCVLAPALLPWIPFRRFSVKGLLSGLSAGIGLLFCGLLGNNHIEQAAWILMIAGISSFMTMNFTGSSTFTSLSGVRKEMKTALPVQIVLAATGFIAWIISKFFSL